MLIIIELIARSHKRAITFKNEAIQVICI